MPYIRWRWHETAIEALRVKEDGGDRDWVPVFLGGGTRGGGFFGLKILLSIVMFVVAAFMASQFSEVIFGLDQILHPVVWVFAVSLIVPIFYDAPFWWRVMAGLWAMGGGVAVMLLSLFVVAADPELALRIVWWICTCAVAVSVVICFAIIRIGRKLTGYK